MLIEFVSKTVDGRTAAPRGNRGCAYREGERARRRGGETSDMYRLPHTWPLLLSPSPPISAFLSSFPTTRRFLSLYLSLPAFLSRFLTAPISLSFSRLGSRGGKACIIRRNSTGINPRTNPASAPLCRATNLFNHSTVERQRGAFARPQSLSCLIVQRVCFSSPRATVLPTVVRTLPLLFIANLARRLRFLAPVLEVVVVVVVVV